MKHEVFSPKKCPVVYNFTREDFAVLGRYHNGIYFILENSRATALQALQQEYALAYIW